MTPDDKPAVMSSRDLWRIAIELLMEKRRLIEHEEWKEGARQEVYPNE